jgi:hypothetical protein
MESTQISRIVIERVRDDFLAAASPIYSSLTVNLAGTGSPI